MTNDEAAKRERPSLLGPEITDLERMVEAMPERPGWVLVGMAHDEATYEQLSQEDTDYAIVRELRDYHVPGDEIDELERLAGAWWFPPGGVRTMAADREGRPLVRSQIGGIHSDPFVRVLAFRAWKARDIGWVLPGATKPAREGWNHRDPPIQNIPRRRPASERGGVLHDRHCELDDCDGQCVER